MQREDENMRSQNLKYVQKIICLCVEIYFYVYNKTKIKNTIYHTFKMFLKK